MKTIVIIILVFFGLAQLVHAQGLGKYEGTVVTEWLEDGRSMKLQRPFAYIDPEGYKWDAPAGSIIDGASIPQIAWSFIGGPFEGKYRTSSVIHDVACKDRTMPWQQVHMAFYNGMIASGVERKLAKIMYGAVYRAGPRWVTKATLFKVPRDKIDTVKAQIQAAEGKVNNVQFDIDKPNSEKGFGTVRINLTLIPKAGELSQKDFEALKLEIEKNDISLEEIRTFSSN